MLLVYTSVHKFILMVSKMIEIILLLLLRVKESHTKGNTEMLT